MLSADVKRLKDKLRKGEPMGATEIKELMSMNRDLFVQKRTVTGVGGIIREDEYLDPYRFGQAELKAILIKAKRI